MCLGASVTLVLELCIAGKLTGMQQLETHQEEQVDQSIAEGRQARAVLFCRQALLATAR